MQPRYATPEAVGKLQPAEQQDYCPATHVRKTDNTVHPEMLADPYDVGAGILIGGTRNVPVEV